MEFTLKRKNRLANFRLSEEEHDYLYTIAESFGVSKTDAIRILLRRFIRAELRNEF